MAEAARRDPGSKVEVALALSVLGAGEPGPLLLLLRSLSLGILDFIFFI